LENFETELIIEYMTQKSLFITGAAQGIGKATASIFIAQGWSVGIFDINKSNLNKTVAELGDQAIGYLGSVTNESEITQALQSFTALHEGKLDLLINNAGILYTGEFYNMDFADNKAIFDVNVTGLMRVTHLAFPYLKKSAQSRIVNVASLSCMSGIPQVAAYAASKAAVKSLTESFSVTFAKHGIIVNDVLPHIANTKMVQDNKPGLGVKKASDIKLTPEQVAAVIWKAAHGNRLHCTVGIDAWVLYHTSRFIPRKLILKIVKSIMKYN